MQLLSKYGGPEVLKFEEYPDPVAGPGEVLVRVAATSVNPIDYKRRAGLTKDFYPINFPGLMGADIAGTVVTLGSGVEGVTLGLFCPDVFGAQEHLESAHDFLELFDHFRAHHVDRRIVDRDTPKGGRTPGHANLCGFRRCVHLCESGRCFHSCHGIFLRDHSARTKRAAQLDDGIAHTFVSTAVFSCLRHTAFLHPASREIDQSEANFLQHT